MGKVSQFEMFTQHKLIQMSGLLLITVLPQARATSLPLDVSASVESACIFTTGGQPTELNFGTYDPTSSSPKDAVGSATVMCTFGTPLYIWISTVGARQMDRNGDKLNYELYTNATRNIPFPSAQPTNSNFSGSGSSQTISYYGRIPTGQYVPPGNYSHVATFNVAF